MRFFNFSIWLILIAFVFCGCTADVGNFTGSDAEDVGSFRLTVEWPEQSPPEDGRYIPAGTQVFEVSIDRPGGENFDTFDIVYPETALSVDKIPIGAWVATIKAYNTTKTTLYAQRKEAFIITECETTASGNLPLGVAISGTTAAPVFEPQNLSMPLGKTYYFQNWLNANLTLSLVITGITNQTFPLSAASGSGFSQAYYSIGVEYPEDARTATFGIVEKPGVTGGGTVSYPAPLQSYWVKVVNLLPKTTNGANGVWCYTGSAGTVAMVKYANYDFIGVAGQQWNYGKIWKYGDPSYDYRIEMDTAYNYGTNPKYVWLIIPLNGGFEKFEIKGTGYCGVWSGGIYSRPYLYHNGTSFWDSNITSGKAISDGTGSIKRDYDAGDVLKLHARVSGSSFGGISRVYWDNVQIRGIP